MKKKVKKLQVYVTLFGVVLTGCRLQDNVKAYNTDVVIEKEQGKYFERTENSEITYDDLVLTLEEKGIDDLSSDANNAINAIEQMNMDSRWIDLLDIDSKYRVAYTSDRVESKVKEHSNLDYYDGANDDILWEELANKIYNNSIAKVEEDYEKLISGSNDLFNGYESLTYDEIKIVLKQLEDYTKGIKEKYPEYDMKRLACQLSDLSLVYKTIVDGYDEGVKAASNSNTIRWYINADSEYPDLTTALILNEHEFKHLISSYCFDEYQDNGNYYVVPSGIKTVDDSSLYFSFIEEAIAEEYASDINNVKETTYFEEKTILDNIRLVLSLQDDYIEDGFFKYSVLRNPIAMVQQFPVLNNHEDDFKKNLKMLSSYETALSHLPYDYLNKVESIPGYNNIFSQEEKFKEVFTSLTDYAQTELSRMFFNNLIVLNEQKADLNIDYNFFLLRLFEKRMNMGFDALNYSNIAEDDKANYNNIYNLRLDIFMDYLSHIYHMDKDNLLKLYQEYSLDQSVNYPNSIDTQKQNFYNELANEEYNAIILRLEADENPSYVIEYNKVH